VSRATPARALQPRSLREFKAGRSCLAHGGNAKLVTVHVFNRGRQSNYGSRIADLSGADDQQNSRGEFAGKILSFFNCEFSVIGMSCLLSGS